MKKLKINNVGNFVIKRFGFEDVEDAPRIGLTRVPTGIGPVLVKAFFLGWGKAYPYHQPNYQIFQPKCGFNQQKESL